MAEPTMFVRKASGLVRSWSVYDGFIYSFFSVNLLTLGFFTFSYTPFIPEGNLIPAIIISTIFIMFEVIVYGLLVAIMPRAGGDYVWQSRILGGGIGFVMSITGWGFILWHWVPLYGTMLVYNVIAPSLVVLSGWFDSPGLLNAAAWFTGKHGLFLTSLIVIALAFFYVGIGMKGYARVQKVCFYLGSVGVLIMAIMLIGSTRADFIAGFNSHVASLFGGEGDVYQQVLDLAASEGYNPIAFNNMGIISSLALIPFVLFWNLWPNWGATLYGEVRGASDFRRNFASMALGLVCTAILAIFLLSLFSKTFGWEFYHAANYDFYAGTLPISVFPFPGLLTAFLTNSPLLQLILILLLGTWWFGWSGTVFLSSTRIIFAAAFDRVLPEWVAQVTTRTRAPVNALIVMAIPSVVVSALNAYMPGFTTCTYDTTVVIAITYFATTIAAIILPYKDKTLYEASPIARYTVFGLPLITVSGVIFGAFLAWNLYMWITNSVYGVNNPISAVYMLILYALAVIIYAVSKKLRSKQGIDLDAVHRTIPVD